MACDAKLVFNILFGHGTPRQASSHKRLCSLKETTEEIQTESRPIV